MMFRHAIRKCCYLQAYQLPRKGRLQIYITPIFRQQQRGTGSSRELKPCPPTKSKKKYYFALGVILVEIGAVIGYAKYDPDFRERLTETVPGSNEVIKFVFEEEKTYKESVDDIIKYFNKRFNQISNNVLKKAEEMGLSKLKETEVKQPKVATAEVTDKQPDGEPTDSTVDKAVRALAADLLPTIIAIKEAVKDEADAIIYLVDKSLHTEGDAVWKQIESIKEEKQKVIDDYQKQFQPLITEYNKRKNQLPNQNNVKALVAEVTEALKALELEKVILTGAINHATEVEQSRSRINSELQTLLPGLKIGEKGSKLSLAEVDLFMLYAYSAITGYQQEIKKFDTFRDSKLRDIIARTKANVAGLDARIERELQNERAKFEEEFQKRKAEIEANCDKDITEQFKRQTKAHHAVLEEALADKEKEVEQRIRGQLEKQYLDEKKKYDASLKGMLSKMIDLNEAVKTQGSPWAGGVPSDGDDPIDRMTQERKADQGRELWGRSQDLADLLKAANAQLMPLKKHIKAIKESAVKDDEFVESVIASIPRKALCRGVFSEEMLRSRFEKVEKVARRVAQVPEGGTSLPLIFLAFLQSLFIVQAIEPIPSYELANQPIDTSSLNNFEILQRARYWMERGDFEQTLRYMNLLKGGARAVAKDWMEETRILLETQQAANVLKAYAIASGLIYL